MHESLLYNSTTIYKVIYFPIIIFLIPEFHISFHFPVLIVFYQHWHGKKRKP